MIRQCTNLFFRRNLIEQRSRSKYCTSTLSTDEEKQKEITDRISINASLDEPPTSCCQSGCANCVYIVWAEAVAAKMQHAGPEIAQKIIDSVEDPSMKAYLEMELRIRGLKK